MITIEAEVFARAESGDIEDLKTALQHAIELEHATMPPYLYARYSLGRSNRQIGRALMSVVKDEMTHMLLAGNLLKAVGGNPSIDRPDFVPDYPRHLPGSVAGDFIVPLKRFSKELVETVLMRIEEPEHILDFEVLALTSTAPQAHTIGEFYRRIRKTFEDGGDDLIVDRSGDGQPTTDRLEITVEQQKVTSARKAIDAIDLIVEQGEGTLQDPHIPDGDEVPDNSGLAHYYRFAELVHGRIKRNPDATPESPPKDRYIYDSSDLVPFDEDRVLLFPDNPRAALYDVGSAEREVIDNFNRRYTKILKLLHQAYNTSPGRLEDAISEMHEMGVAAQRMAAMNLGPTFEYLE